MGEEALPAMSPPRPFEAAKKTVEENSKPLQEVQDQTLENHSSVDSLNQDQEPNPSTDSKEMEQELSNVIQTLKDDDFLIPSPILKGISGPDLSPALQFLGTKYNDLMKKHQTQIEELETLRANCEMLRNKCLEECEPKYETLKKKYTEECAERKRLYNELIELKGNIRVFCRCRPLCLEEISKGYSSVVEIDPSQDTELQIICSDNLKKQFKFDHTFGPTDDQEAVFAETMPIVKSVLDGYDVCIFAYGQTGTGKTFTMEGTPENRGVNYRALEELFRSSKERSSLIRYQFSVSTLEVYNEKIRDLLAENADPHAKKLEIKQVADGTQDVPGLVEAQICSIDEVWEKLKTGARNRSVGSTNANELSSRSHCLVRVTIKSENLVSGQRSRSHMWLVDLAGSERVAKIEAEGERLKESQFINKSLSALGDVISALASKNPHIPYRNSKLTHLLQSSLGGDCKTLMFAQISPSSADLGETLCSLNFASRVQGVEHGPARKQSDPAESFKLKQMAEKLRQEEKESARLNESLQLMQLKYASRENVFKTLQEKIRDAEQTCRNYQQKVRDLENQLADRKKDARVRDLENQLADRKKDARDAAKFSRPPLAPIKQRPPLGRITNRLPPSGPRRSSAAMTFPVQDKENILSTCKASGMDPTKPLNKARRISLTPVVRHIPVQTKRRVSIATLPNEAERYQALRERRRDQISGTIQASQLILPRRRSVAAFTSFPGTPQAKATPEARWKFGGTASSSKYASPPHVQALWKSKIPTISSPRQRLRLISSPANSGSFSAQQAVSRLCFSVQKRVLVGSPAKSKHAILPTISSPRQRLRLISSPANSGSFSAQQAVSRLCFSVQKRMLVGSPAKSKHAILPGSFMFQQAPWEKEIVGRLGTAQRVLCKNRRKSVI